MEQLCLGGVTPTFIDVPSIFANPKKTAFMILNLKQDLISDPLSIKIGKDNITAESSAKLLGITLDANQKWKSQIQGAGGVISNLNLRLYLLRRLAWSISNDRLRRIADSLYTSKIRYGVQLYGKVRLTVTEPTDSLIEGLQITQNKFARFIHGSSLLDRSNTSTIYKETQLFSVNQIMAKIKLLEVWKSINIIDYPIQWKRRAEVLKQEGLKASNKPDLVISGRSSIQDSTFINDAARVWNNAPGAVKACKTLYAVKKQIKIYTRTLPI